MPVDPVFSGKDIDIVFNIVNGNFGNDAEILTLTGHRVSCQIVGAGLTTGAMCNLRIEGMSPSDMNRLSTISSGMATQSGNTVTVRAGPDDYTQEQLPDVFTGYVTDAFVDYAGAPNVAFQVQAYTWAEPAARPIDATSFNGDTPVSTALKSICDKAGLVLVNHGVADVLHGSVYYEGTAREQIQKCANAVRARYFLTGNSLDVFPATIAADTETYITLTPETGLIGYPGFCQGGVEVACLFNPRISLYSTVYIDKTYSPAVWLNDSGQLSKNQTAYAALPPSNGFWVVVGVQHDIASETPGAPWMTKLVAVRSEIAQGTSFAQ